MTPLLWVLCGAAVAVLIGSELRSRWGVLAAAEQLRQRGRRDEARRLLESGLQAPALLSRSLRIEALYRLARLDMEDGRYEDAARRCQEALPLEPSPGQAARVRERLAECLEGLREPGRAREERRLAAEGVVGPPPGVAERLEQARAFEHAGDLPTACDEYRTALSFLSRWRPNARCELTLRLALATLRAGSPEEAARLAEEALAVGPADDWRITAHSLAAVACSQLRRADEADRHRQEALAMTQQAGNEDRAAAINAAIADAQRRAGRLLEGIETADGAAKQSLRARRHARLIEAQCLTALGRYEAARSSLSLAQRALSYPEPSIERRSQALLQLFRGQLEADAGEAEAALAALREASAEMSREPRTCLWHDCAMAYVLALLGRRAEASALALGIETRTTRFQEDPATLRQCWAGLGRTHLQLGNATQARTAWLRFLAASPDLVDQPEAYYRLGEAEVLLGTIRGARSAFEAAAGVGATYRYARLAQQFLAELDVEVIEDHAGRAAGGH
jgi:tetratricopeptide (TPR) repeat protein